jgi:hypothetical protein
MFKGIRKFAPAVALAGALLAAGLPGGSAKAQSVPFTSGFQIQNLSSTGATISMAFYGEGTATAPVATVPGTIPANGQVTFASLPSQVAAGFKGSAVISSDQKIAAIANLISPTLANPSLASSYVGVTGGARTSALPLIFKDRGGANTFFSVQNVGQASTVVTVEYSNNTTQQATIPPGGSARFDQGTNAALPSNFAGSAIVTSTASDIAAVVTQYDSKVALTYNGFKSGTTNPVFPLVNINNGGSLTGISLQNLGAASTNVTVTYTKSSDGSQCTETKTIASEGTAYFGLTSFTGTTNQPGENCPNNAAFVGSATVTANSASAPLAGIVNQVDPANNKGGAYSSFNAADATDTVVFPLIMDRNFTLFTGFSVVNVGAADITITCTYSGITAPQVSPTIKPGAAFVVVNSGQLRDKYVGSATCKANSATAKIVGIANQVSFALPVDTLAVYEATTP